ncbi:PEP-CTERM sorting domain-containing protein [Cellvibrio sp.]|uniref:PEP-CTERM sorting domain-containing protein n=1 Tax=Cellvibrio sp. TaxID=1965322 RepID=UPI00396483CB
MKFLVKRILSVWILFGFVLSASASPILSGQTVTISDTGVYSCCGGSWTFSDGPFSSTIDGNQESGGHNLGISGQMISAIDIDPVNNRLWVYGGSDMYGSYRSMSNWKIHLDFPTLVGYQFSSITPNYAPFAYATATPTFTAHSIDVTINGSFGYNSNKWWIFDFTLNKTQSSGNTTSVPEPSSLLLFLGAIGLLVIRRKI